MQRKDKQLSVKIKSAPRLFDPLFHGLTRSLKSLLVFTGPSLPSLTNNNNNADKLKSEMELYKHVARGGSKT